MLAIGLVEEIMFRGVVQYALVRHWDSSTWQLLGSVVLGAFIFGSSHMIWAIFGKPVPQTALQSLSAFLAGIYYGVFVLSS
jgi:membrane protease YdiL (CAAX protease family)